MKKRIISFLLSLGILIVYAKDTPTSQHNFMYNGHSSIIVCPDSVADGRPWIWRPAFFGAFPSVDEALLKEGFHVVYHDMTHRYGSPQAIIEGEAFYNYMLSTYGLSPKVTLEGFSRGGYYALNWAIAYPDKVACIYLDNPVCDLFSWPGEKRKEHWNDFLAAWGITSADKLTFKGNPLDNLEALAQQRVPILAVCGDSDKVVPFHENMKPVRDRYRALGAPVELILKPGADHHPHSLEDPERIVDFIIRNQPLYQQKQDIHPRGTLTNTYVRFEKERKGRVAFLGGSITHMRGWRDMTKTFLQQSFPNTEFEFIEVGIPSTGTTPHAFRLENDVLSRGDIDLLFIEGAVNDDTNGFPAREQVRGMEGVVRHTLSANPYTDIVILHFVYNPFLKKYALGQTPDVILNHERVANHYLVPSVNLAHEVYNRIEAGEFDWSRFGGIHPSWFGHKYYAASLERLLNEMWNRVPADAIAEPHPIPEEPLDTNSYYNGHFADLDAAQLDRHWQYIPSWSPDNGTKTRPGFVDVPVLYSNKINATFTYSFKGRGIGLFAICGPYSATLEYSIDGAPYKLLDTFTPPSKSLYLPWAFILDADLDPEKKHKLKVRISSRKNEKSKGHECIIRNILINN